MNKKYWKICSFLPMVFMMLVIFCFSAQEADESSVVSTSVGKMVVRFSAELTGESLSEVEIVRQAIRIEGYVRKIAHMLEYAILAMMIAIPCLVYGLAPMKCYMLMLSIGILYAASDEFHQTMVAGRSGSVRDVLIDSVGVVSAVVLTSFVRCVRKGLQKQKRNLI